MQPVRMLRRAVRARLLEAGEGGSLAERDASVTFTDRGRTLAVATISRDRESLLAELDMEHVNSAAARHDVKNASR